MVFGDIDRSQVLTTFKGTISNVLHTAGDSDWDVLAIVDKPRLSLKDRTNLQYPIWDKGLELGQEINVFPYTRSQWEAAPLSLFKYNVMQEGIVI